MSIRRAVVLGCALGVFAGCAGTNDCTKNAEVCIRRCQNLGTRNDPKNDPWNGPYSSLTECERQCGCRKSTASPAKPSPPPTITGN